MVPPLLIFMHSMLRKPNIIDLNRDYQFDSQQDPLSH
jgi:hypothetical protein